MTTAEDTKMTQTAGRKAEAHRIAQAETFPIRDASEDWTFFTLDDPLEVEDGRMIRTHFEWVHGRFEGFVS